MKAFQLNIFYFLLSSLTCTAMEKISDNHKINCAETIYLMNNSGIDLHFRIRSGKSNQIQVLSLHLKEENQEDEIIDLMVTQEVFLFKKGTALTFPITDIISKIDKLFPLRFRFWRTNFIPELDIDKNNQAQETCKKNIINTEGCFLINDNKYYDYKEILKTSILAIEITINNKTIFHPYDSQITRRFAKNSGIPTTIGVFRFYNDLLFIQLEENEEEGFTKVKLEEGYAKIPHDQCPICLETVSTIQTPIYVHGKRNQSGCGMTFHNKCIEEWRNQLKKGQNPLTCPHCTQIIIIFE